MGSRGTWETDQLRDNVQAQLHRLLTQLEDLDQFKVEFSLQEFEEMKAETRDQLKQFQRFLDETIRQGDLTLVDEFGSVQLAIQAAVSDAFKAPEVIRMFAQKDIDSLRSMLSVLSRDSRLKILDITDYNQRSLEILTALKHLKTSFTSEEAELFESLSNNTNLEHAFNGLTLDKKGKMLFTFASDVKDAQN